MSEGLTLKSSADNFILDDLIANRLLSLCTDALAVARLKIADVPSKAAPEIEPPNDLLWHNPAFSTLAERQSVTIEQLALAAVEAISTPSKTIRLADGSQLRVTVEDLQEAPYRLIALSKLEASASPATTPTSDVVTGLADRRQLLQVLQQRLAIEPIAPFALLFMDLDGFKQVNDTLGHQAGDSALIEVAARLRDTLREGDTISRYGGDEFVCLLSGVSKPSEVEPILARLLKVVSKPLESLDGKTSVSASFGVAYSNEQQEDSGRITPEALIHAADCAMYANKKQLS